jgi:hypothetical protein
VRGVCQVQDQHSATSKSKKTLPVSPLSRFPASKLKKKKRLIFEGFSDSDFDEVDH